MKNSCIILLLLGIFLQIHAQPITGKEKEALTQKIIAASDKINSIQCDFKEEKKLSFLTEPAKATGIMYYKASQKLRWEYQSPETSYFVYNDGKVFYKNAEGSSSYNANSNKMIKALSGLIIGFINGKGLQDNIAYKTEYFKEKEQIYIKIQPQNSEMKKVISSIQLYLNATTLLASKIIITEVGGDVTQYQFSNVKTNVVMDDKLFNTK